jgi:hypothetical protein
MEKVSVVCPKSIAKKYIESHVGKVTSNSRLYSVVENRLKKLNIKSAPGSICRRIREAKAELRAKYEFQDIEKKSAEDWFMIVES